MEILRDQLVLAYKEENFLQTVYEMSRRERHDSQVLIEELARIHNERLVNVVAAFKDLKNGSDRKIDFFLARHVLEKVLPKLNEPVLTVMECAIHLLKEAGHDLAAGTILEAFVEFLLVNSDRPKEAIRILEKEGSEFIDLLPWIMIAGAQMDADYYLDETLRFANDKDIEVRLRAIFALGRLYYPPGSSLPAKAISFIESLMKDENDDRLLGDVIRAAFFIYKHDNSLEQRVEDIIKISLLRGQDHTLLAAGALLVRTARDFYHPARSRFTTFRAKPLPPAALNFYHLPRTTFTTL